MADTPFDDLSDVYESMIDWPKRLANEEPFYRRLFDRLGSRSVVDVACGTGRHAAMFHGWGMQVEGADISPRMIELASAKFGQPPGLRWVVRGYHEPVMADRPFDVAICVGNSLALAAERATAQQAIVEMLAVVHAGGAIVVHLLNLWRLDDGPCVWQKCKRTALPQGEVLIVKGVHRSGRRGFVELIVASLEGNVAMHAESAPLLGLEAADLEQMARRAGAQQVQFFGGYQDQPYERQASTDLLMVAKK